MCLLEEYETNKGYHEIVIYQSLQSFDHLKEESRWQWVMKKEMRRESETPHNMHSTASSRATNQVTLKKRGEATSPVSRHYSIDEGDDTSDKEVCEAGEPPPASHGAAEA